MTNLSDSCFKINDLEILKQFKLPKPSDIKNGDRELLKYKVASLIDSLNKRKAGLSSRNKTADYYNTDSIVTILKIYRDILNPEDYKFDGKYKIGSGGRYGDLVIHLPGLLNNYVLDAYKNGVNVMKQQVDPDTIELLTKRFNSSNNYSELSKNVFNLLNQISGIPINRYSKKISFATNDEPQNELQDDEPEDELQDVIQFDDQQYEFQFDEPQNELQFDEPNNEFQFDEPQNEPQDDELDDTDNLLARLEDLVTDFLTGLNFTYKQEEFIDIVNKLYDRGSINVSQRHKLFRKYL